MRMLVWICILGGVHTDCSWRWWSTFLSYGQPRCKSTLCCLKNTSPNLSTSYTAHAILIQLSFFSWSLCGSGMDCFTRFCQKRLWISWLEVVIQCWKQETKGTLAGSLILPLVHKRYSPWQSMNCAGKGHTRFSEEVAEHLCHNCSAVCRSEKSRGRSEEVSQYEWCCCFQRAFLFAGSKHHYCSCTQSSCRSPTLYAGSFELLPGVVIKSLSCHQYLRQFNAKSKRVWCWVIHQRCLS